MIYEPEFETMSSDDLEQLQIERLQETLNRVYRKVEFYKNQFDYYNINIEKIKSIKDLQNLPFTTRNDLVNSYPYGMFALPLSDIIRLHTTTGTSGKKIIVGYSQLDIIHWTNLVARVLTAAGVTNHDFVQIAFNYNLTTGGLGFHYGAEKIRASVIPSSNEDIKSQISIMKDFKTTTLISTPGYALHIASVLKEMKIHPEELFLRVGLFGAEPWSENLRAEIEEGLHITAYDNYGLSEIMGPGVSFECSERNGLHVNEDHFIVEVIDPVTLKPLPEGEKGELIFTTIAKQGFPLIRYRTGDISSIKKDKCPCGRTFIKMDRVSDRTDDRIFIEGRSIMPSQIEEILLNIEGIEPHYCLLIDRVEGKDTLEIQVELSPKIPNFDEMKTIVEFREKIREKIEDYLGIKAKITIVESKKIARSDGNKIKRFIDKRNIK